MIRKTTRRALVGALSAASLLLASGASIAQDAFPGSKPIRFIVPWNAGGSNDIAARAIANILAEQGIRVVVENVPGATGSIGMTRVANADPDGYTVGMGTSSTLSLIAQGLTPLKNEQFASIARVTTDPLVLLVPATGPATTVESFVAHVKKNNGKITIGTPGNNNLNHYFAIMTGRISGGEIIATPYSGGAKVIVDLAGKQIDAAVLKPSESKGQMDAGLVKAIGVFANDRLRALPDVPTFKEKGFDVYPYGMLVQMAYIVAPAGISQARRDRLTQIFSSAIQSAKFKALAAEGGALVDDLTGFALDREINAVQKSLAQVATKVFPPVPTKK